MRTCRRCNIKKDCEEFGFYKPGKRRQVCKGCIAKYDKDRYRSEESKQQNREGVARYRASLRDWYNDLKNGPCVDCGGRFHFAAMQWDHLPGSEKVGNLGRLINHGSKRKILAEIAKCELVCANCHAVRTHRRALDTRDSK